MVINVQRGADLPINTYPKTLHGFTIVEFDGNQPMYGSRPIPRKYGYKIDSHPRNQKLSRVSIYHLNSKGSFTPVEFPEFDLELLQYISQHG